MLKDFYFENTLLLRVSREIDEHVRSRKRKQSLVYSVNQKTPKMKRTDIIQTSKIIGIWEYLSAIILNVLILHLRDSG